MMYLRKLHIPDEDQTEQQAEETHQEEEKKQAAQV
jgi:hypothetical protein